MKTQLASRGNPRGICIPRSLLAAAGLAGEVERHVQSGAIVIAAARAGRAGGAEAARQLGGGLLDPALPTRFDEDEWRW
jgi:antitoxin component of MazEF toxin-antitoxin module